MKIKPITVNVYNKFHSNQTLSKWEKGNPKNSKERRREINARPFRTEICIRTAGSIIDRWILNNPKEARQKQNQQQKISLSPLTAILSRSRPDWWVGGRDRNVRSLSLSLPVEKPSMDGGGEGFSSRMQSYLFFTIFTPNFRPLRDEALKKDEIKQEKTTHTHLLWCKGFVCGYVCVEFNSRIETPGFACIAQTH